MYVHTYTYIMTCFWDGIIGQLENQDYELFKHKKIPRTPHELYSFLKQRNIKTSDVTWNDEEITSNQIDENYKAISQYVFSYDGYNCSTFEPFLFLISELFRVNIIHDTYQSVITYKCSNPRRVLHFSSNKTHFWQPNKHRQNKVRKNKRNKKLNR